MNGRIIVVTHKKYDMPEESIYFPVCVGKGISTLRNKYQPDDIGENISEKNNTYCELTAIYWVWKNLNLDDFDYIGIAHYRRHFSMKKNARRLDDVLKKDEVETIFKRMNSEVIITTPKRRYFSSIENHYIHSKKGYDKQHKTDIENLRRATKEISPEYESDLNYVLKGNKAHMLNMFIMPTKLFSDYCTWLFPIINRIVELSEGRVNQNRYAGALSEFLLDVWLIHNNMKVIELQLLETEKVSFLNKVIGVMKRKFKVKSNQVGDNKK